MLSIRNLVKIYPGGDTPITALAGVDLDVPNGMFGLLGPNGAGKSTLMKILAGLLEPTSGSVTLDGEDIVADPSRVWCQLGYLPQDFGFYPHMTGEQMLAYLLELKGLRAKGSGDLVSELLERVGLTEAARRKTGTYSGGMRQRLGIAQAIAGDPRLLIVDEPTAGLDPGERLRFYRLLAELSAQRTVLLSTHLVDDVGYLCPRFAVIRGGRLLASTRPADARQALEGKIFEATVTGSELARIYRRRQVTQAILVEGVNQVRIYEQEGAPPAGFEPVEPTLEDAYFLMIRTAGTREKSVADESTPACLLPAAGSSEAGAPEARS